MIDKGKIGETVEIHGFPQEGDVSIGEIIIRSVDDVVPDVNARFRKVRIYTTNRHKYPSAAKEPKINITPTGLIPLETQDDDQTVQKYRFNFRDKANSIVTTQDFQDLHYCP